MFTGEKSTDETIKLIVNGRGLFGPDGVSIKNYLSGDVDKLRTRSRAGRAVTEIILHETVTRSVADTIRILERRKLGAHLVIGPDGVVTQHGDLAKDRMAHAGRGHNGPSVGIEMVNPYYPKYLNKPDMPWDMVIDAPWAHKKQYVVPTPAQAEATAMMVKWLTSADAEGLSIPRRWLGVAKDRVAMGRIPLRKRRSKGIYAHHYFGHADGAWLVLYSWLRIEVGMNPSDAHREAVALAVGAKRRIGIGHINKAMA